MSETKKSLNAIVTMLIVLFCVFALVASCSKNGTETTQDTPQQDQEAAQTTSEENSAPETETTIIRGDVSGTVTYVISGDTVEITFPDKQVERVRYLGISAPENGQAYAEEATAANAALVQDTKVYLERGETERDEYGRLLRYVYVGTTMVNAEMVALGYAHTTASPPDDRYAGYFLALEKAAQEAGRGFWRPTPSGDSPASAAIIIVEGGMYYHLPGCPEMENGAATEITVNEARARGYQPCGHCQPPQ